jgi:P4 family phage/plasmid primase-like protien
VIVKKGGIRLNQGFFAAKFATEHLLLYEPTEGRFYGYDHQRGIWLPFSEHRIKAMLADDMKVYSDSQNNESIVFASNNSFLSHVIAFLKGQTERHDAFERTGLVIHVGNGMLHIDTDPPELREFSPSYYSRNQSPIPFVRDAECPRFEIELLAALSPDDQNLLQRYCGSLLLGKNRAQRILVLSGPGGTGKSTILEVVEKILGIENVTELRTECLGDRFETGRYIGKSMLTGKDVPTEFLMRKSAPTLKKLVGNDFLTAELKNNNHPFELRGQFNVAITCNKRLRVRLESDVDAWRRRLLPMEALSAVPAKRISEFGDLLIREEGPGILNWMIKGAIQHSRELRERGDFTLTDNQKALIDVILAESDSIREFVSHCVQRGEKTDTVTVEELLTA